MLIRSSSGSPAAGDAATFDSFGRSVSISGDTVVVGAFADNHDAGTDAGSAYVFRDNGAGDWPQIGKLIASDAAGSDQFGFSVAIHGDTALVGAITDDDDGSASGAAYVFRDNGSAWVEIEKLAASDASASDQFGSSVAIDGEAAAVGALLADGNTSGSGAAYIFEDPSSLLIGDYNGDGKVSSADFTVWRDNMGAPTLTNRDPDNSGPVGEDDYYSWMENYGQPNGEAAFVATAAVPEPASWMLASTLPAAMLILGRRRRLVNGTSFLGVM